MSPDRPSHSGIESKVIVVIARVPLIVADMVLIYITWARLSGLATLRDIRQSKRLSLSDVLCRDGTMYFVVLFVLNILHLVFSINAITVEGNGASYVAEFTASITAILISCFLLELQEADRAVVRLDPDDPLHFSKDPYDSIPSFISSLGAFINPDLPSPHDDESARPVVSGWHPDNEDDGAGEMSQAIKTHSIVPYSTSSHAPG
ncbi:hypothetical protein L226DRAFT_297615 [Lentinus tigrinus ALCF2SS1-7]|uniref:uncharacterized protein n=1 Tax=Lentinus tigrinus ALCF2SS1-7 TaxID=1328758 RepID=UPI001165F156|nr:hypothetical protein L226DRAFT_297615 [Lentinus tigrinus ALCF2SS1-7]